MNPTSEERLGEILRAADPFDSLGGDMSESDSHAGEILAERIRPKIKRRARRIILIPVAVACAAAAIGAGFALGTAPAKMAATGCYQSTNPNSDVAVLNTVASNPLDACRSIWSASFNEPPPDELEACVGPSGQVVVYPGRAGLCDSMNLRGFSGAVSDEARGVAAVNLEFRAHYQGASCIDPSDARGVLKGILDKNGMADWSIDDGGFAQPWSEGRPCAYLAMNESSNRAVLLPVPRA